MKIQSNGSKWWGQEPDSVQTLIDLLNGPGMLDPFFTSIEDHATGEVTIRGNLYNVSHVFNISGTKEEMQELREVVEREMQADSYQHLEKVYEFEERLKNLKFQVQTRKVRAEIGIINSDITYHQRLADRVHEQFKLAIQKHICTSEPSPA